MLKTFILILVVLAVLVFVRLLLLRIRMGPKADLGSTRNVPLREGHRRASLELETYAFQNFDYLVGPTDPEDFYEQLTVNAGVIESLETRTFFLWVTTPKTLARKIATDQFKFGRDLLIVERYDIKVIDRAIRTYIGRLPLLAEDVTPEGYP